MASSKKASAAREAALRLREQRERERKAKQRIRALRIAVPAALVVLVIAIVVACEAQNDEATPIHATESGDGLVVGNGPVTVDIYADYLCPGCRSFEADAQDEIERYLNEGRITLVFHPISILDDATSNQYSTRAAAAAGCASDGGKLLEFGNSLFAQQPPEDPKQPGHTDDELIEIGRSVGLGDDFAKCVKDKRYIRWVSQVTRAMEDRGLRVATPTILVNGTPIDYPDGTALAAAVEAASSEASASPSSSPSPSAT